MDRDGVIASEPQAGQFWAMGCLFVFPWLGVLAEPKMLASALIFDAIVFAVALWVSRRGFEITADELRYDSGFGKSTLRFREMTRASIGEHPHSSPSWFPARGDRIKTPSLWIESRDGPTIGISVNEFSLRTMVLLVDALEAHRVPIEVEDFWLARRFALKLQNHRATKEMMKKVQGNFDEL